MKRQFLGHTGLVHLPNRTHRARLITIATLLLVALAASACGGGARPTLTTERIPADEDIDVPAADPEPQPTNPDRNDPFAVDGGDDDSEVRRQTAPPGVAGEVQQLTVEILETFPHDPLAFTQGLELQGGLLLESTGLYNQSDLRRVDPTTGEVLEIVPVADEFFAEGITQVGDELIQLTWRENTALYYDADTLELLFETSYEGEGWGLCYDGTRLIMTDGTPNLIFRDPGTFEETSRLPVTLDGQPVANLNETECVHGEVWANIWGSTQIVRIDPETGQVTASVNAESLAQQSGASGNPDAVLNGIAWDDTSGTFLLTGKLWPTLYRVNFVAAG